MPDQHLVAVSVAQLSVTPGDPEANVRHLASHLARAETHPRHLVVLPECYLTGYVTESDAETRERALGLAHPSIKGVIKLSAQYGVHLVVGFLERDGSDVYNSAALISPQGMVGVYRKQHLLVLAADRFVEAGAGLGPVFDTEIGRIGIMVCYDLRFPEAARVLALKGADIVAMPTNWPTYAEMLAEHVVRVRALENGVFVAVANRPDSEAGYEFIGRSQVASPNGEIITDAGRVEGIFTVQVDLGRARVKRRVVRPGEYELDLFADRRPSLYQALVKREARNN